ncbi:hypothetical protein AMECASPLE_030727 [Ameca splendens]|uniref:Uncharacterized protein n=1 Tax=Ameca splendens TaxID=208324 RepID=A0ABV0Z4W6_9TELE
MLFLALRDKAIKSISSVVFKRHFKQPWRCGEDKPSCLTWPRLSGQVSCRRCVPAGCRSRVAASYFKHAVGHAREGP